MQTYSEGVTDGYRQGADAVATFIQNRLHEILTDNPGKPIWRGDIKKLLNEVESTYELEPVSNEG